MTKLTNPVPIFLDARGALLDAGRIYIGAPNSNPVDSPIALFWDAARTVPAAQPLRTLGGVIMNAGNRAFVYMAEDDYALRIEDADGNLVDYVASIAVAAPQYQPLDSDLTALSALSTTDFGRSLLGLVNAAALKSLTGIPDCIPQAGGITTGNITRQSAGSHLYQVNPAYTSGRVFGPEYTVDPTSLPGDIWLKADG